MATTVMQTEIPRQMRRIQDLRRRTRSKYPRICTLSARSAELIKTGCSFKTFLQVLPRPVHNYMYKASIIPLRRTTPSQKDRVSCLFLRCYCLSNGTLRSSGARPVCRWAKSYPKCPSDYRNFPCIGPVPRHMLVQVLATGKADCPNHLIRGGADHRILPSSHFLTPDLLPCRAGLLLGALYGCFSVQVPLPESCISVPGS